jgi:predicted enzyme related to lactoylglutathione lyase
MPRPIHFEIPADDPERAMAFYTSVFGWSFTKWEGPMPYWLVSTGEGAGIDGGLSSRATPDASTVNTIDVTSCTDAIHSIQAAGGTILSGPNAIPGVGWLAYAKDTEGTTFGVMQSDPGAA